MTKIQKNYKLVLQEMDQYIESNACDFDEKTVLDVHFLQTKLIEWLAVLQGVAKKTTEERVVLSSHN